MTMLTHINGPFEPATYPTPGQGTTGTGAAQAHLAIIKHFCMGALAMLALGGVATAVVALRAALYFWRYHF